MTSEPHKSELAGELAARTRRSFEFPCSFLIGEKPVAKIKMRIATKGEQDRAVIGAHAYVAKKAKEAGVDLTAIAGDRDILQDAKTCFILFEVCRDAADDKYPAFLGPMWMIDHLTSDEIEVLLNMYEEALRKTSFFPYEMDAEKVEIVMNSLAENAGTDVPNVQLAAFTRLQLGELLIRASMLWRDATQVGKVIG